MQLDIHLNPQIFSITAYINFCFCLLTSPNLPEHSWEFKSGWMQADLPAKCFT